MTLNARNKGATGEREIALQLNGIIGSVMTELGTYSDAEITKGYTQVQRNPLQSAIGGKDLTGTFDLCIEVKRVENLSGLESWWKQACASAAREEGSKPILLYRQNNGKWRCRMYGHIPLVGGITFPLPVDISWEYFYAWFKLYVKSSLQQKA